MYERHARRGVGETVKEAVAVMEEADAFSLERKEEVEGVPEVVRDWPVKTLRGSTARGTPSVSAVATIMTLDAAAVAIDLGALLTSMQQFHLQQLILSREVVPTLLVLWTPCIPVGGDLALVPHLPWRSVYDDTTSACMKGPDPRLGGLSIASSGKAK
ncbi:hypothetical protein BDZ91DRAFT_766610 [Kalaharituber pfeilii]|nr:hypothetical protein BDZ91DRAFT_766610 [Kalaharituber pfeilii]